jgi:hypothetical protein
MQALYRNATGRHARLADFAPSNLPANARRHNDFIPQPAGPPEKRGSAALAAAAIGADFAFIAQRLAGVQPNRPWNSQSVGA